MARKWERFLKKKIKDTHYSAAPDNSYRESGVCLPSTVSVFVSSLYDICILSVNYKTYNICMYIIMESNKQIVCIYMHLYANRYVCI